MRGAYWQNNTLRLVSFVVKWIEILKGAGNSFKVNCFAEKLDPDVKMIIEILKLDRFLM